MVNFVIRRYTVADHKEVLTLHKEALLDVGAYVTSGVWEKDLYEIEKTYLDNGGEFLVGVLADKIIAMGAFRKISTDMVELKRMRVHPEFQRRGYGQQLLSALEERASILGYATIHLDTLVKQTAARRLYKKNGYRELRKEILMIQGEPYDIVFYEKKIG